MIETEVIHQHCCNQVLYILTYFQIVVLEND